MSRRRTAANPFMVHSNIALNLMSWETPPSSSRTSNSQWAYNQREGWSESRPTNGQQGAAAGPGGAARRRWPHFFSSFLQQMDPESQQGEERPKGLVHKIRVVLPHVVLFCTTLLYGLVGALVFQSLERPFEVHHLREHSEAVALAEQEFLDLKWIQETNGSVSEEELEVAVDNLIRLHMEAFEQGIRADELANAIEDLHVRQGWMGANESAGEVGDNEELFTGGNRSPKWHFHSSLFFTATLLTSIGYGNLVPISPFGRLFCIGYAFLGIPLTLITIADVAKYLSDLILKIGDWLERRVFKRRRNRTTTEADHQSEAIKVEGDEASEVGILRQPGAYTKAFVIFLLFAYMWTMAVLFSRVQPSWGFLESLYFTLITLVTIGFGDFCPTLEGPSSPTSSASFGWILFIFVGLTLSTLTVDMIGSSYIERIHTLGRGFHLGSLLTMLKIGRGDAGPDSARLLRQLHDGAYIPADLKLIPYIDQLLSQRPSTETVVLLDNGNGPARFPSAVSFLLDPKAAPMSLASRIGSKRWRKRSSNQQPHPHQQPERNKAGHEHVDNE